MGFKWTERVYRGFDSVEDVDKEGMSILVAIAHCTNDITNAGFPSTATIARMTHISRSTVFKRLNTLEAKGYLSHIPGGFRDGRQYANEYTIKIPKPLSVAETTPVPATDSPRPSDGQEVVRAEDTNRNVNHKDKKNSLGRASPTGAFRLTGVGVPGVSERLEPTTTGKLMDFCRTSSQADRQQLMSAALMKGQPAVEKMLARLKSTRAGKGMDTSQLKALVLQQLALLPDAI